MSTRLQYISDVIYKVTNVNVFIRWSHVSKSLIVVQKLLWSFDCICKFFYRQCIGDYPLFIAWFKTVPPSSIYLAILDKYSSQSHSENTYILCQCIIYNAYCYRNPVKEFGQPHIWLWTNCHVGNKYQCGCSPDDRLESRNRCSFGTLVYLWCNSTLEHRGLPVKGVARTTASLHLSPQPGNYAAAYTQGKDMNSAIIISPVSTYTGMHEPATIVY